MMTNLSIRKRILLLAIMPVLFLAVALTVLSINHTNSVAALSADQLKESLYNESAQLDAFLELATTATAAVTDPEQKKAILRTLRYEKGQNYFLSMTKAVYRW